MPRASRPRRARNTSGAGARRAEGLAGLLQHRDPGETERRQDRHEEIGAAAEIGVERAGAEHHEPAAEPGRDRRVKRLRACRGAGRHGARQVVHRAQMSGAEGQRVQKLQPDRRRQSRQQPRQGPTRDPAHSRQHQQPARPDPRREPAADPEEGDLGGHPLGPQAPDDGIGKPEPAPVQRAEPVIDLVARLQRRGRRDKEPEARVERELSERRPPRRARVPHRRPRQRQAGAKQKRRRAEHQRQHPVPRRSGQDQATPRRRDDKADGAPHPDAPVIEPVLAHRGEGDAVAERLHRRHADRGGDVEPQQRPEPRRVPQRRIEDDRHAGQRDHHRLPPSEPVGQRPDRRRRRDLGPERGREHRRDLAHAEPLARQPHRPERRLHADDQKAREVEEGEARGRGVRLRSRT